MISFMFDLFITFLKALAICSCLCIVVALAYYILVYFGAPIGDINEINKMIADLLS